MKHLFVLLFCLLLQACSTTLSPEQVIAHDIKAGKAGDGMTRWKLASSATQKSLLDKLGSMEQVIALLSGDAERYSLIQSWSTSIVEKTPNRVVILVKAKVKDQESIKDVSSKLKLVLENGDWRIGE